MVTVYSGLTEEQTRTLRHAISSIVQDVASTSDPANKQKLRASVAVDFAQLRDDILLCAQEVLELCAREHNTRLAVSKLPFELLERIASYLTVRERCTTSLVCSHWRAALLSSPSLWKHIVIDICSNPELFPSTLATLAERSRQLPLVLELRCAVQYDAISTDSFMASIVQCMPRIVSLSLHAHGIYRGHWDAVLRRRAPRITTLHLVEEFSTIDTPESCYITSNLFDGHAPFLSHVTLDGLALPSSPPEVLQHVQSFAQLRIWHFSVSDIANVLRSCPSLRALTLHAVTVYDVEENLEELDSLASEHNLESLCLAGCQGSTLTIMSAAFNTKLQRYVSFRRAGSEAELAFLLEVHGCRVVRLGWSSVRSDDEEEHEEPRFLYVDLDDGTMRLVGVSIELLSRVMQGSRFLTFQWLKHLSVPSDIWHLVSQRELPALRELDIIIGEDGVLLASGWRFAISVLRIETQTRVNTVVYEHVLQDFVGETITVHALEGLHIVMRGVQLAKTASSAVFFSPEQIHYENFLPLEVVDEEPWRWRLNSDRSLFV